MLRLPRSCDALSACFAQNAQTWAAGVDDEPPAKAASRAAGGSSAKASGAPNASEWMKQLERTMESFEQVGGREEARGDGEL